MIAANALTTPELGLIVWSSLTFFLFFYLLYKFAWPPILKGIYTRNEQIRSSLMEAEKVREDMKRLRADNEEVLRQARAERDRIVKEASETAAAIVSAAHKKAESESAGMLASAIETLEREREKAVAAIRAEVASLSIGVAERILREQLKDDAAQMKLVERYIDEIGSGKN